MDQATKAAAVVDDLSATVGHLVLAMDGRDWAVGETGDGESWFACRLSGRAEAALVERRAQRAELEHALRCLPHPNAANDDRRRGGFAS